jgi:prepilin-type N-terminal cleavage/methylation domain-containing protein
MKIHQNQKIKGFSLVEMTMVLLILGILGALFLPLTNAMLDNNRRKETTVKLEALEKAFTRFVITNRRLPCPANGALATGSANEGLELAAGGACTVAALTNGVVPWRTLGLAQNDAIDAWGSLISYRVWGGGGVANSLTQNASGGVDMSGLNPATAGAVMGWLTPRGFRLCNTTPCAAGSAAEIASKTAGNGIAYFLISHGSNRFGAYLPGGAFVNAPSGPGSGPSENINRNNLALRTAAPNDFYIDAQLNENAVAYYDDLVLHPTIIKVALDANLQPR